MPKFASAETYFVKGRRGLVLGTQSTLADAKGMARDFAGMSLRWKREQAEGGLMTWYSDGDYSIELSAPGEVTH